MSCNQYHLCYCGTGKNAPHEVGKDGCVRQMGATPEPLGKDPDTGFDMWLVTGNLVTEYTLKHQRGYHQHPCGCWSDWNESVNSIDA